MNGNKFATFLLFISLLFLNNSVFAMRTISINNSFAFNPVNWHTTFETGGFAIENQTSKSQFVQVVLKTGCVVAFTRVNDTVGCYAQLGGNSVMNSTVCEVAPGERLYVDLDFPCSYDATGTYQIQMRY